MKNRFKKFLSVILAVIMLCLNSQVVSAFAQDEILYDFESPVLHPDTKTFSSPNLYKSSGPNVDCLENYVDIDLFRDHLIKGFASCPSFVDISKFKIPDTPANRTAIQSYIWYETPELFHVNNLGYTVKTYTYIPAVYANYRYNATQYKTMYSDFTVGANKLLENIKGNENLDDVEKALLLHDRLALSCEYTNGTIPIESYSAYGVFAKKDAVCMGYALAYDYLLREVGIDSYYCSSNLLNHAWNIVYINGKEYHVDVTWDDPVYDRSGRVNHDNFLRSTEGIISTGHNSNGATDFYNTPTDVTYDNYFWQNSDAAFQLVGDDIYYIDGSAKTLNKISNGVTTTCKKINATWRANASASWVGYFGLLATDGEDVFYSLTNAVYKYDTSTGSTAIVFKPDLTGGDYYSIYGFKYENCQFICEVFNTPNFLADTKASNTKTQEYHSLLSDWIVTNGSSSTVQGAKHKNCLSCGKAVESTLLPLVSIEPQVGVSADYSACVLFTENFACSDITNLISCESNTKLKAIPSYNTVYENLFGTGSVISIYNSEEYIYDLTVIVKGDLNGDSVCDALDVQKTEIYSTGKDTPTKEEIYGANGSVADAITPETYQNIVNFALGV